MISSSGVATLVAIVLVGPLYYLCKQLWRLAVPGPPPAPASVQRETGQPQYGSAEYLLVLTGYAIGIGNIWRFPYLVGKHGGGAFVFAYLVCLFLVAIPLFLMELVLGQSTRRSTVPCFTMIRPRWRSLGYAQAAMLFYALTYYNVLIAYCCVYIVGSLRSPLPWTTNPDTGTHAAHLLRLGRAHVAQLL